MPLSSTSEPNSEIARAKLSAAPAMIAGNRLGRMIRRKIVNRLAPSEAAASSTSRLELLEHRLHGPDDERQRHEREGEQDRRWA